jgi:hypothetical protein
MKTWSVDMVGASHENARRKAAHHPENVASELRLSTTNPRIASPGDEIQPPREETCRG